MGLYQFFTQEQLDDLPHDDGPKAFAAMAQQAQMKLSELTERFDGINDETAWQWLEDTRYSFMNIMVAAAKKYGIEPFASMKLPKLDKYSLADHRQFLADLDHYTTQLVIDNSMRGLRESVPMPQTSKDRIRTYLYELRQCVEKSTMPDPKRSQLLDRLDEFERELEKRRLTLLALTKLMLQVAMVPGALWASADITTRLLNSVVQIVAEAKSVDDENRQLPPFIEQAKLSPPREDEEAVSDSGGFRPRRPAKNAPAFESGGMDDDMPF